MEKWWLGGILASGLVALCLSSTGSGTLSDISVLRQVQAKCKETLPPLFYALNDSCQETHLKMLMDNPQHYGLIDRARHPGPEAG